MNPERLGKLFDRLSARVLSGTVNKFELLDIATVLMLVKQDLVNELMPHLGMGVATDTIRELEMSLQWVKDNAHDALTAELHSHVLSAVHAASSCIFLLRLPALIYESDDAPLSGQESSFA